MSGVQDFIGGRLSLLRQEWVLRLGDESKTLAISREFGLSDSVARLLSARGFELEDLSDFLHPRLKNLLPDPYIFADMEKGVERVVLAIESGDSIAILADYDVDGATSLGVLGGYLSHIGVDVRSYIPERLTEGYGISDEAISVLSGEGHKVLIALDCGTSNHESIGRGSDLGMDIVVIDHHKPQDSLPSAFALINPNIVNSSGYSGQCEFGHLAAVGVTFLFTVALNRHLRGLGWFDGAGVEEPSLTDFLDLVALGTVCDVVPLTGLNRAFVIQGLKILNRRSRVGIAALCVSAEVGGDVDAGDLGFRLGPRLNAASRMGYSPLASRLLSTGDIDEARAIAFRLEQLNSERRGIEAEDLSAAMCQARDRIDADSDSYHVLVHGEGWREGVVGIIASRLKDSFKRPALVIAVRDGIGRGSGRSIGGVDLGLVINSALREGLLISGGGHSQAVGLQIEVGKLLAFESFVSESISQQCSGERISPSLNIDIALGLGGATVDLLSDLSLLEPFGSYNVSPRELFCGVGIVRAKIVGERHISCFLRDSGGCMVRAVAFSSVDTALGVGLLGARGGDEFHVVGRVRPPYRSGGRMAEILIEDVMEA